MQDTPLTDIAHQPSHAAPVVQQEEATLMNLIAKMATDPAADVPKLERLIKLRNDEIATRAKREYDDAFVQMKEHLPLVIRTHENKQTNSKYAKMEDINQKIDPILSKYGFGSSSKVIAQTDASITMFIEVRHRGGHSENMTLTLPIDDKGSGGSVNKTKVHGIASTIMYLRRVGLCALLNISTGDDKDGNSSSKEAQPITLEQAVSIDTRARALGEDNFKRFMKWVKVDKATDILDINHRKTLAFLETAEAEVKKATADAAKAKTAKP